MAKWMVSAKKADFNDIAQKCGITPILARIIRNREVVGAEETGKYLKGTMEDLHDPLLLNDMDAAALILQQKINEKQKIRIIGDYDVDGICSSFILWRMLTFLGADCDVVLPDRVKDGYGINERMVEQACREGVDTLLTCDNGIAAAGPLGLASSKGMSVIVTDHHEIPYELRPDGSKDYRLPEALAIVEPKIVDEQTGQCRYPYPDICGAEVAFKLAQVMLGRPDITGPKSALESGEQKVLRELVSFAALATVCDVMPLLDENRIIVRMGLKEAETTDNLGLRCLILTCGLGGMPITCYHAGFVLGPCLNASGRLDTAQHALTLFMEHDERRARIIAAELKELNDARKTMTEKGVEEAQNQLAGLDISRQKVLVVQLNDCHESIVGIIAGRIREKYVRPTFVLTRTEEGIVKGSGRSIEGYDMFESMNACKELFLKFGGHKMAAGLSIEENKVDELRRALNENCQMEVSQMEDVIHIDMELPMRFMTMEFVKSLKLLEPTGNLNPRALFVTRNLTLQNPRVFGKNRNVIKYRGVDETGRSFDVVYFTRADDDPSLLGENMTCNVVYYPDVNVYNGRESLQFIVRDLRILG